MHDEERVEMEGAHEAAQVAEKRVVDIEADVKVME